MKSKLITYFIAFFILICCSKNEGKKSKETVTAKVSMQSKLGNVDFKKMTVKGSKLVLNSKTSFETKLHDLNYIGTLKPRSEKSPDFEV